MNREIKNAKITGTMLGYENHGIMTCVLWLDCGGVGQKFGGYALDSVDNETKIRSGTKYGMDFIVAILETLGMEKWEDLKGTNIRVECSHTKVFRIGHYLKDQWFCPEDLKGDNDETR